MVSNGETCGLNQSCTLATKFVVVPAPTVIGIQPSQIQQPSLAQGQVVTTIDIYGTNFTPGSSVTIGFDKGTAITVNNTIFIDSGHLKAELVVNANTPPGPYVVVVTTPSGTDCADGPTATGEITITVKPEIFCETVTPDQVVLGGPPTAITVTGKGFEGFTQMAVANGNAIYELSISDETDQANSITGILTPPLFTGFNYDLLGENWDVILRNPSTGAILACQDNFAIFAGTTITDFVAGAGPPTRLPGPGSQTTCRSSAPTSCRT